MPSLLKRMPRMKGSRRRRLPTLTGNDPKIAEREPDALQKLINNLGGRGDARKIAKRVMALKPEYPAASIPELVVHDWLTQKKIPFTYQAMLFGGRRAKGGLVPDFVVNYGGKGLAWQIQGEYWHSRQTAHGQKDFTNTVRLIGTMYQGIRIESVVELWEKDIYRKRPQIFTEALQGNGLRE